MVVASGFGLGFAIGQPFLGSAIAALIGAGLVYGMLARANAAETAF